MLHVKAFRCWLRRAMRFCFCLQISATTIAFCVCVSVLASSVPLFAAFMVFVALANAICWFAIFNST